ncbi:MAG: UDP-glucose 4-epimerase [Chloroflexi bacterium B3_Chlor]|nr:MAG: UDP-glucose 4-epimerase [Chloroflexi bacterium B3_Chlor]
MRVLVTGGAGFIGSHVVDALIGEGHSVAVVDDFSSGKREHVNPKARLYELDIRSRDLEQVFAKERPEVVNHHAAQVDVRDSVADPIFDADVNIVGSLNLLECAREHGVRKFIYASTGGAVYGEPIRLPCDENHPLNPVCPYGVSKLAVEHYLYVYRLSYGLEHTILRYPNVYGPRQDPSGEGGVAAIFARQMVQGEQVVINGSGEQERDFIYVHDIVRANMLAMDRGQGQVYNLGCGVGTSINELFAKMKEMTGYASEPVHGPPKIGETLKIYLDGAKVKRELRWEPAVALEEGLRATIESFRDTP